MPFWRACQKSLAKRPEIFPSYWNFLEQNAKILQSMSRNEKKEKNFPPKITKTFSGHAKSSWEIIVAKSFAKKYKIFLWKSEKTTKLLFVFQFLLFSKLILWAQRMHLSQSNLDSKKSGLLFVPDFFPTKKRKNVAQDPKTFENVLNIFRKKYFREKCPIEMQIRQLRWKFLAKRLKNFSSKYRNPWEKRFFSNYSLRLRESQLWIQVFQVVPLWFSLFFKSFKLLKGTNSFQFWHASRNTLAKMLKHFADAKIFSRIVRKTSRRVPKVIKRKSLFWKIFSNFHLDRW